EIGVLPAPSRNTPTPTSILSGRGSALTMAIRPISESSATGSRSARPRALISVRVSIEWRLAKSGVVIHRDAVAHRHRLAGQDVTGCDFLVGEPVARRHFDLTTGDFRPAGRADAGLAGERRRKPGRAGAVKDIAGGERHFSSAAVERHRNSDTLGLGLQLRDLASDGFGGTVGGEALDMDSPLVDSAIEQRALGGIHHWAGPADEPAVDLGRIRDEQGNRLLAPLAVEHAVEQLNVLFLGVEEMIEFE